MSKKESRRGICIKIGTIPSKSLREAVLFFSGFRQRNLYGASYQVKKDITLEDFVQRCDCVVKAEQEIIRNQLTRNNVDFIMGMASFIEPHRILVRQEDESDEHTAEFIVLAVGTDPARQPYLLQSLRPCETYRRRGSGGHRAARTRHRQNA